MSNKRTVPKFATEEEEVAWWEKNRSKVTTDFTEAAKAGELKFLSRDRLAQRLTTQPVTIRLLKADIDIARKQAANRGLPYQTYIRSLLHETLAQRQTKEKH